MRLKDGELAPAFSATTLDGRPFDLAMPRQKPLLLSFYRYASCPLCNLRVHQLIEEQVHKNVDILAVFQSPASKIRQYVGRQEIPFPIIGDPDRRLYQLYGVESSWAGFARAWTLEIGRVVDAVIRHQYLPGTVEGELHRIPADFLIDPGNRILRAYYGKDIGDHLALDQITTPYETR